MKKAFVSGGLIAVLVACLLAAAPGNDDKKIAPGGPFKGRIIVVGTGADGQVQMVLENAKIQQLGERSFLVGTGADLGDPDEWMKGQVAWVPIDDADYITEFASVEEYNKIPRHQP